MLNKTSIRMRLIATMSFLGLLIVSIGGMGVYGMNNVNGSLNQVYSQELVSTVAIGASHITLGRVRFTIDRVVFHPDAADAEKTLKRAEGFLEGSEQSWQKYVRMPHAPEEQALADDLNIKRAAYIEQGLKMLIKALREGKPEQADTLMMKNLTPLFGAMNTSSEALDAYHLKTAAAQYEGSQKLYATLRAVCLGGIAIGAVLIALSTVLLLRAIFRPLGQAIVHFAAMAEGNLSRRIDIARQDEMGALLNGLAGMQERLSATVRSVRDGSGAIATATSEIAAGNLDLSRRTEQQAASLEETASSLEELTSTVRQNADNARQANVLSASASAVAVRGGALVAEVVETMSSINDASRRIVDIIGVIDGIAFQTNILALNAAVEAARAGEQGRGFAVVASEVRNLAQRSAAAAKEIKQLIGNSVARVDAGARLVGQTGSTMDEIVTSIGRVTDIMAEITAASAEQSSGIDQINQAVSEMDAVTQQNAALVEQAAAAAASLQEQATELEQVVGVFMLGGAHDTGAPAASRRLAGPAKSRLALAAH